jgi:hypothetical protein
MTATKVRLKLVPQFQQVMERNPGIAATLNVRARGAAMYARTIAPVASGDYRNSIGVEGTTLVATDFKAHWVEWGTVLHRAHATLRTAARRFADRLRED